MGARRRQPSLRCSATVAASLAACLPVGIVTASEGTEATAHAQLDEIVVTARRREESLVEVPIALSVFSQPELDRRQVFELAGLQYAAPSLVITTDQTNRATSLIAIRGQFEPMSVPTVDSTVGVYLDDVYISRITGANLRLIDMERVEVLRGPQGTLFGRNTIGGAVNLVTKAPSSELEAYVQAAIGNYGRRELSAVANLPVLDGRHAFRLAVAHTEHHGYGRSLVLDRELNDENTDFVRARLRLALEKAWRLDLAGDYSRFDDGGQLWTLLAAAPASQLVAVLSGRPDDDIQNYVDPLNLNVMANRAGSVNTAVAGVSTTLNYFGPGWTFKSISAARRLDGEARDVDQDGTPYDLGAVLRRTDEQDQFSQEFQLSGQALDERLDWTVGVHYFLEKGLFDQEFLTFSSLAAGWTENLPNGSFRNDSAAIYAQVSYAVTAAVRLTAGLRVNEDGRQLTVRNARRDGGLETCRIDPALRDSPQLCQATLPEQEFRHAPYLLGLDFRPIPGTLLYTKVSRGYRSGGYNLRGATPVDLAPFGPERVTAWEAGAKTELLDSRLRLDVAIFRSQFDEIQLVQRRFVEADAQTYVFIENGGEARIDGGEIEFTALLGAVRFSGALGVVDAKYTRLHPDVDQVNRDSRFLQTPAATAALAADWTIDTAFGRLDLHLDHSWRDDVPFEYDPRSIAHQDAYGLWNAMARFHLARPGLCLGLWGRNMTDERYITRALNNPGFINAAPGDPRTWGMNFRYPCGHGPNS